MFRALLFLGIAALVIASFYDLHAQATLLRQMTTPERVKAASWWPTKMLPTRDDYTGPQVCATCHADIAVSQQSSEMARTLMPASASQVLQSRQKFAFGPYAYTIAREQNGVTMMVSDGTTALAAPLAWAFGVGRTGQSYMWLRDGTFYESRFNYFGAIKAFDVTPGRMRAAPDTLESAVGRPMSEPEARNCLACHSTGLTMAKPIAVERLIPGVTCEACHGPGANHVAFEKSGMEQGAGLIMNPKRLSPGESVDFCGSCHGTWWDVELSGGTGVATVRFPAYRLEKSRCWGNGDDARVTCVACHNPHKPLVRETAAYDRACLQCHMNSAHAPATSSLAVKSCRVATKDCASCHMPKYQLAEMHNTFTDHRIRVVRDRAAFVD